MVDKDDFVARLNEDLATEYQSIVQYVTHIATMRGAEYQGLADELAQHLTQELGSCSQPCVDRRQSHRRST